MNLKKSLKSKRSQSVVEYIVIFSIVAALSFVLASKVQNMFRPFVTYCIGAMQ